MLLKTMAELVALLKRSASDLSVEGESCQVKSMNDRRFFSVIPGV